MKYKEEIYLIDQGEFPLSNPASSHAFANQHSVAKLPYKRIVENQTKRANGRGGEEERDRVSRREGCLLGRSLYVDVTRSHKLNANKI